MDYYILLFFTLMAPSAMTVNSSENHPDDSKFIVGYGVEFSKIFQIENSVSKWAHVVIIPLEDAAIQYDIRIPGICPVGPREMDNTGCHQFHYSFGAIQAHVDLTVRHINDYKTTLHTVVNDSINQRRVKRGIIDGGGSVLKHLFGTATMSDISNLQNEILSIEHGFRNYSKGFVATMDSLHSMRLHTNKRITNVANGLRYTSNMVNETIRNLRRLSVYVNNTDFEVVSLKNRMNSLTHLLNLLTTMSVTYGHNLSLLLSYVENQVAALSELMRGRIPIKLISPKIVKQSVDSVESALKSKWPMFKLAISNYLDLYALNDIKFHISENNIYVTLHIPITLQESLFDVYKVISMPMALGGKTAGLSKIINTADYLAINSDNSYFLELSGNDLTNCQGGAIRRCMKPFVFNHADSKTCTLALFQDQRDAIDKLCKTELILSDPDAKQIQYIKDGYYFIGFHYGEYFHEICQGREPRKLTSCKLCLLRPGCGCALESDSWFIPPNINSCSDFGDTQMVHPVNLMILEQLNDLSVHLSKIPTNASFHRPLDISMPKIDIYTAKMDQVISSDKRIKYDLKRAAKMYKANKKIFGSVADKLNHDFRWLQSDYTSSYIMSAPSIGLLLGIDALALAVLSLYKWNRVSALLMYSAVQLDRAEGSELIGLTPPPWLQSKMLPDKDTPGPLSTASCDPHYIQNLMMATVPVGIITMFLLAWLIRLITKMYVRFDSHIVLVLSNDHDCVHLPIKELSECPTAYRLSDKDPHILRLNGLLRNVLYVNWRNTHLHNISTNEIKTFPSSLQVPLFQRLALSKMLSRPYNQEILIQHKLYNYYPMRDECECTFDQNESVA